MQFDVLEMISAHGVAGRGNDDRVGASSRLAWVIDGATDLGPPGLVGPQGGAAWLAQTASAGFATASAEGLAATCAQVFDGVSRRFASDCEREAKGPWEYPKAAFAAVQLVRDSLQIAWAADCPVLLRHEGCPLWCTSAPDTTDEAAAAKALGSEAWKMQGAALADRRAHRGQPGHQAIGVDPSASIAATSFAQMPVSAGDMLLLMSDGFSCLISDYGVFDAAGLMQAAEAGLAPLLQQIRDIEEADPDCQRFPRFKKSDDATALLLRVV